MREFMPENYRCMMDSLNTKKKIRKSVLAEILYIVFEFDILLIRFHKNIFLSVNTNSGVFH
jgi:hypothetical protein